MGPLANTEVLDLRQNSNLHVYTSFFIVTLHIVTSSIDSYNFSNHLCRAFQSCLLAGSSGDFATGKDSLKGPVALCFCDG